MQVPASYLNIHTTERLIMRPLTADQSVPWESFLNNPGCIRFFPGSMIAALEGSAAKWISFQQKRYEENRFGLLALFLPDGTFIGQCGLLPQLVEGEIILEIGYHLLPEFQGKGYASEAAVYFKEYTRIHQVSSFVTSIIHPENQASQSVARRNNMTRWKEITWAGEPAVVFRYDFQD